MGNVVINAEPFEINISPLGFHQYSNEFLKAGQGFKDGGKFSPVPYYLYCRSIELSLKSFLLSKGVSKEILKKKLGHNLEKIINEAESLGLNDVVVIAKQHRIELKKANEYYVSKGFEYFEVLKAVTGYQNLPDLLSLSEMASLLVLNIELVCMGEANNFA